ncbi:HIG1 domain family member 1A, mitochondrial isoform X1 [Dermacentor silvarum]|uniref:HIG1 domain family member 1A, mitochondrial isoform X1 n=1 Tax=Dermacentor silvarum TaxID=543639 RepID=UPI002100803F|nr:HIG1 domain family member 1A, mitochondrial isoform X1 [Dermacentor silvarum]
MVLLRSPKDLQPALMTDNAKKMASPLMTVDTPYKEETATQKFKRKAKESPFMVIGLTGCVFICSYGAFLFRRRKKLDASLFLMQLRVTAQGTVIGCLMLGVTYNLFQRFLNRGSSNGDDKGS